MEKETKSEEPLFENFGKKVDNFVGELGEATEKLKKEIKDKYEELKQAAEKMKSDPKNKEKWNEVEQSLKKAGEELKNAFEAAFRKN